MHAIEVGDPVSLGIIRSFELRLASIQGLPRAADASPPPANDHQSFWIEVPTATWALHLLTHPEPQMRASALGYIDEALERVNRYHNRRLAITLSVLHVLALDVCGKHDAAIATLAEVVREAVPRGVVRTFVDCGPRMKELLDDLARGPEGDASATALRSAFAEATAGIEPSSKQVEGMNNPLTYRELETLRLLAWHMSNKEIAARLEVSPAAVKKRLESIYAKLEVNDRHAAITTAVARSLIEPRSFSTTARCTSKWKKCLASLQADGAAKEAEMKAAGARECDRASYEAFPRMFPTLSRQLHAHLHAFAPETR